MSAPRGIGRARVAWRPSYRIVPSRFPPVGLFDRIASPADLDALFEIEGLTNPRLRQELGDLSMVPRGRRISGPGTTPVMAAFLHANPDGSRFSDGSWGVYYAARERDTAIAETIHHRQAFLRHTGEPPCVLQMRCYLADVTGRLHDIRGGWPALHDPDAYAASQAAARTLREAGSDGIVYDSARRDGGQCVAVFYPDLVSPARQGPHLHYHWDGARISHYSVIEEVTAVAAPRG
ncbi:MULTISPECIES: RES family NAD+ phosphorylase [unclassified Luteimonas]|uniref:RES family NAD+ phosphorylase n=1 Tax=unclassified Luteimonas TaxID=2629088 RepID=UPI0018F0B5F4|nr:MULTISPECIES: RES family NAD+ phosphorylase [unclassified Luteimonas]MBJ6979386.1 RES family NAD+ phosphorylase [Luteimonas sp. MC1895]MBJ6984399.1 RES family NAD+ phosphorylase [Luteimonas sp. MC1750]QQO04982.1 RES family NAD+ phosphorylase [Luteimonas sp. MC1750]